MADKIKTKSAKKSESKRRTAQSYSPEILMLKDIGETLSHIAKWGYLPLIIGITYQFVELLKIDRVNFFSWTHIFSDTVIYIPAVILVWLGYQFTKLLQKLPKIPFNWLHRLFKASIEVILIYICLIFAWIYFYSWHYATLLIISFLFGAIFRYFHNITVRFYNHKRDVFVCFALYWLFFIALIARSLPYGDEQLVVNYETSGATTYNVNYINDKYAFVHPINDEENIRILPIAEQSITDISFIHSSYIDFGQTLNLSLVELSSKMEILKDKIFPMNIYFPIILRK